MNGIAISVYDKFEEVGVLIDIIRKNWKENYFISLCSNHPEAKKYIKDLDVNNFTQGSDIKFSPEMPWKWRGRTNLVCRVLDTIKKSCLGAIEGGAEYVMHLHSDAWPLDEYFMINIINKMKENNKKAAVRGFGLTYYAPDTPLGNMDDMFFIFESDYFKKISFFNYHPLELFPHKLSPHGVLILLFLGKVGIKNFFYYADYSQLEYWDGKKKILPFERAKPSIFDPITKLLHVHTDAFPNELGKSVQAYYLVKYNVTKGENIKRFIEKYYIPKEDLFEKLKRIEDELDRGIRRLGYNPIIFGRNFSLKRKILKKPKKEKIKILIKNLINSFYYKIIKKRDLRTLNLYHDSLWPYKDIYQLYNEIIIPEDFPDEYKYLWFKDEPK